MQEIDRPKVGRPKSAEKVRQYYYYCKPSERATYEAAIQAVNAKFNRHKKPKTNDNHTTN
jgi:hypothetical protein